jgi:hypothetical protein
MNESLPPTPASVTPGKPGGFFQNLVDVYFSPREAFTRIVRRPAWILPAIAVFVVSAVSTGVWMAKVDAREFTVRQMEEFGGKRWEEAPAEAKEQGIEAQVRFMPVTRWVRVALGTPIVLLGVAAVLLFVFRFFYGAEVSFVQSLAITSWSVLAIDLLTSPLRLLVMWLKGDWNIEPQFALQASPAALLDPSAPKWQWAVLATPDVFSLWLVFLLATGFAVASRRTTGSALWGVGIPWLLLAVVGVAMAALFM